MMFLCERPSEPARTLPLVQQTPVRPFYQSPSISTPPSISALNYPFSARFKKSNELIRQCVVRATLFEQPTLSPSPCLSLSQRSPLFRNSPIQPSAMQHTAVVNKQEKQACVYRSTSIMRTAI
ncbi:hypothetical protein FRC12_020576 [Ceratobasidium sp. 428]|nr:hypothetical protein FRC12_020576 [Ceratobasidium sp. 428]